MIRVWFNFIPREYCDFSICELGVTWSDPLVRVRRADGVLINYLSSTLRKPVSLQLTFPLSQMMRITQTVAIAQLFRKAISTNLVVRIFDDSSILGYEGVISQFDPVLTTQTYYYPELSSDLRSFSLALSSHGSYTDFTDFSSYKAEV